MKLLAAGMLLATSTVVLAAPPGVAAAATCRGEQATIVGSSGTIVLGTSGRDVIVSNGSKVSAGDGDDVICVTGRKRTRVISGPGDDLVDTRRATAITLAILQEGSDRFVGGPVHSKVFTGDGSEADVVRAGSGSLFVWSGSAGTPNSDRITLGRAHDEVVYYGTMTDVGSLSGATRQDTLTLDGVGFGPGDWTLDLLHGALVRDGQAAVRWQGTFGGYELDDRSAEYVASGTFRVVGTAGAEWVVVDNILRSFVTQVHLGRGDDFLRLTGSGESGNVYAGGAGQDEVYLWSPIDFEELAGAVVSFPERRLTWGDRPSTSFRGFEDATIVALGPVAVTGDDADNDVFVFGCEVAFDGGAGDDRFGRYPFNEPCSSGRSVLRGGPGDDVLRGGARDDRIYGGPGRDVARGFQGTDSCVAERTYTCERRP